MALEATVGAGAGRRDLTHTFNKISLAGVMQGTSREVVGLVSWAMAVTWAGVVAE